MTVKLALILSATWTLMMIVAAIVLLVFIGTQHVSGASAQQRAVTVGGGMGVLTSIGYAVLWLPLAAKVGARRRAERARKQKVASKKRPRQ